MLSQPKSLLQLGYHEGAIFAPSNHAATQRDGYIHGSAVTALHSEEYRIFTEALVAARRAAGVTQRELGARLGRDHTFVTKYEGRVRRLDVVEFLQVARALGLEPGEFLRALNSQLGV